MAPTTIYLDHNATTPIDPRVAAAIANCYQQQPANPASQHQPGRAAQRLVEEARDEIGRLLGARPGAEPPDKVILTSGATEANNLALRGLAGRTPGELIVSTIEHPSVAGVAEFLSGEGFAVRRLEVDGRGVVCVEPLSKMLDSPCRLVSVMLGNNETGVLQPVAEVAAICRTAGVPLHTDAAQVAGKLPIDFHSLGASTMSVSAHKFHGPSGIGALLVRGGTRLEPLMHGGRQEGGLRPGTPSVPLAVGMATALRLWHAEADERRQRMRALRDLFEAILLAGWAEIVVHGQGVERLPHTSHLGFPGLDRQALLMALDLAGVACSAGSSCESGSSEPSRVLLAMGVGKALTAGSLRFSLGALTTHAEIEEAARRILRICKELRGLAERGKSSVAPRRPQREPV